MSTRPTTQDGRHDGVDQDAKVRAAMEAEQGEHEKGDGHRAGYRRYAGAEQPEPIAYKCLD
jgi:hypothetical protein